MGFLKNILGMIPGIGGALSTAADVAENVMNRKPGEGILQSLASQAPQIISGVTGLAKNLLPGPFGAIAGQIGDVLGGAMGGSEKSDSDYLWTPEYNRASKEVIDYMKKKYNWGPEDEAEFNASGRGKGDEEFDGDISGEIKKRYNEIIREKKFGPKNYSANNMLQILPGHIGFRAPQIDSYDPNQNMISVLNGNAKNGQESYEPQPSWREFRQGNIHREPNTLVSDDIALKKSYMFPSERENVASGGFAETRGLQSPYYPVSEGVAARNKMETLAEHMLKEPKREPVMFMRDFVR